MAFYTDNFWISQQKHLFSQNMPSWYRTSNFHCLENIIFFLEKNMGEKMSVNVFQTIST